MAKFVNFIVFFVVWMTGCAIFVDINTWHLMTGAILGLVAGEIADIAEGIYRMRGSSITDIDNYRP